MVTSPLDLAREMIELAKKASPCDWEYVPSTEHHGAYVAGSWGGDICDCYAMSNPMAASARNGGNSVPVPFQYHDENAAFIARSRSIAPALAAAVVELTEALALMLTVEVQDPGHVHTLAQRARAQQLLGIGKEMPVQLWLTRFYKACAALAGKPQTQGEVG